MVLQESKSLEPLIQAELNLKHLFHEGKIAEDLYHQGLMVLAFEYSLRGDVKSAKMRVEWCPEEYIRTIFPKQMKEQDGFRHIMYALSKLFVALGEVDLTSKVQFYGRKPAQA